MNRSIFFLPCILCIPWLSFADDAAVLKTEFIYETAPFPSCHASTIAETPAGLVTAWFGGTHEKHPDVGIWLSRHERGKAGDTSRVIRAG